MTRKEYNVIHQVAHLLWHGRERYSIGIIVCASIGEMVTWIGAFDVLETRCLLMYEVPPVTLAWCRFLCSV